MSDGVEAQKTPENSPLWSVPLPSPGCKLSKLDANSLMDYKRDLQISLSRHEHLRTDQGKQQVIGYLEGRIMALQEELDRFTLWQRDIPEELAKLDQLLLQVNQELERRRGSARAAEQQEKSSELEKRLKRLGLDTPEMLQRARDLGLTLENL